MKPFKFFAGLLALAVSVGVFCEALNTGVPIALLVGGLVGLGYSLKFGRLL